MKAVVHTQYGPPEVLHITDLAKPVPKDKEVLVKIHAATVNRTDCGMRKAEPFIVRFFTGLTRPRQTILGSELAGEIEAVGGNVTLFKPGDQVFGLTGDSMGAHAEYICLPESAAIVTKPAALGYEEAAAVCDGAMLAYNYIRRMDLHEEKSVLINGASGSIGTAGVQLAAYYGARITAVCDTKNMELVQSLGAHKVIDYTREDFTQIEQQFDYIFDAVGKSTFGRCKKLLKEDGVYFVTDLGPFAQNPFLALWTKKFSRRKVMFPLPKVSKEDVAFFKELIEAGKLKPVIDRRYPFDQIVDAYRYVETGRKTGNVVINIL